MMLVLIRLPAACLFLLCFASPILAQFEHRAYIKPESEGFLEFGLDVAVSGEIMAVGGVVDFDAAELESETVWIYREHAPGQWVFSTALTSPSEDYDFYGVLLALDGDTLVVSAPREDSAATGINGDSSDNSAEDSGAVYVYVRTGLDEWTLEAYIKPVNTESLDFFGAAIDLHGDTLVVGAPREASASTGVGGDPFDNSLPSSGAAYVFHRNNGVWTQQAYLKTLGPGGEAGEFGISVAVFEDSVAVGAWFETAGIGSFTGAAHTYSRSGNNWSAQGSVPVFERESGDLFGNALALSGTGQNNEELLLAVGATGEDSAAAGVDGDATDNSESASGAVYLYSGNGSGPWTLQSYIKASNPDENDQFGERVALTAGTRPRLLVGAFREDSLGIDVDGVQADNSAPTSGAAYLFDISGSTVTQRHYIKAINTDAGDAFGFSLDADGTRVVVGARGEDSGLTGINPDPSDNSSDSRGAVYLLELPDRLYSDRFE